MATLTKGDNDIIIIITMEMQQNNIMAVVQVNDVVMSFRVESSNLVG